MLLVCEGCGKSWCEDETDDASGCLALDPMHPEAFFCPDCHQKRHHGRVPFPVRVLSLLIS